MQYLGIKEYTNWPTIPQVFINGEFVGGCDILLQVFFIFIVSILIDCFQLGIPQMHRNGELIEELQKVGINSALLEAEEKK